MFVLFMILSLGDGLYGAPLHNDTPVITLARLMENPEQWLGKMVKVEGEVKEVCPMKGCWLDLSVADQKVRIKVKDGDIVFDKKLIGKNVIAEGTVYKFELTKEEAVNYYKHLAEEKGESFDPGTITKGATIYQIGGLGVQVKG